MANIKKAVMQQHINSSTDYSIYPMLNLAEIYPEDKLKQSSKSNLNYQDSVENIMGDYLNKVLVNNGRYWNQNGGNIATKTYSTSKPIVNFNKIIEAGQMLININLTKENDTTSKFTMHFYQAPVPFSTIETNNDVVLNYASNKSVDTYLFTEEALPLLLQESIRDVIGMYNPNIKGEGVDTNKMCPSLYIIYLIAKSDGKVSLGIHSHDDIVEKPLNITKSNLGDNGKLINIGHSLIVLGANQYEIINLYNYNDGINDFYINNQVYNLPSKFTTKKPILSAYNSNLGLLVVGEKDAQDFFVGKATNNKAITFDKFNINELLNTNDYYIKDILHTDGNVTIIASNQNASKCIVVNEKYYFSTGNNRINILNGEIDFPIQRAGSGDGNIVMLSADSTKLFWKFPYVNLQKSKSFAPILPCVFNTDEKKAQISLGLKGRKLMISGYDNKNQLQVWYSWYGSRE